MDKNAKKRQKVRLRNSLPKINTKLIIVQIDYLIIQMVTKNYLPKVSKPTSPVLELESVIKSDSKEAVTISSLSKRITEQSSDTYSFF